MPVATMYLATSMMRPTCPWPPLPCVEGIAQALAYTSLVSCLSAVLLGVLMMVVNLGCGNMSMDGDDVVFVVLGAGAVIRRHR